MAALATVLLSVVVVNWNSARDLDACLASLVAQTWRELEVVVVDNGSTDGSVELVRARYPQVVLRAEGENLGFAEGVNRGIAACQGEWIGLLNNDAVAEPDWAAALAAAAEREPATCGMLQSLLLYEGRPGIINSTGIELTRTGSGRDRHEGWPRERARDADEIFCPTGGAAAYRRSMLEQVKLASGYLDRDHFMYLEDMDLGWRARLCGWSAHYVPSSVVHHRWHGSSHRHGNAWINRMARQNRIRTLIKNASREFLARTAPDSLWAAGQLFYAGGVAVGPEMAAIVRASFAARAEVDAIRTMPRRDIERRWLAGPRQLP